LRARSASGASGAADATWITRLEAPDTAWRLAVKDLLDTAGVRTTYGSSLFADHVPDRTAPAVAALEGAGWTVVGKANLHEFAYGVTSQNPHYGTVANPLAADRLAGGSSGGSAAAVAAGEAELALGTDSGGSIRIPAACCGVVGFKPTHGVVSTEGCFPLAPSFDTVGPLARTVAGCAAAFRLLAPESTARTVPASLDDVRVAVAWLDMATTRVRRCVARAAERFRNRAEIDLPLPTGPASVFMREAADVHRELFADHADSYGDDVRTKLERCFAVTGEEAARGRGAREAYRETVDAATAPFDLLLTPTLGFVAPPRDRRELDVRDAMVRLTYPFNLTGRPALALPCGTAEHGLPASVQVVGRCGDDELVLAVGELLERALAA
jgi:aspartyl-tRNA(Asn)/glutamyl-tRNA(Gln) amidotransferase subunit A